MSPKSWNPGPRRWQLPTKASSRWPRTAGARSSKSFGTCVFSSPSRPFSLPPPKFSTTGHGRKDVHPAVPRNPHLRPEPAQGEPAQDGQGCRPGGASASSSSHPEWQGPRWAHSLRVRRAFSSSSSRHPRSSLTRRPPLQLLKGALFFAVVVPWVRLLLLLAIFRTASDSLTAHD